MTRKEKTFELIEKIHEIMHEAASLQIYDAAAALRDARDKVKKRTHREAVEEIIETITKEIT